jgi:signal transduction histidine kinase
MDPKKTAPDSPAGVRVGLAFLDVRQRRLHWLNPIAQQLHGEGIPFVPADLARRGMIQPSGVPATAGDLPILRAWRTQAPVEAQFIFPRDLEPPWHLAWTATPLRDAGGQLLGIIGCVTCGRPEPDWQQVAELAHDLRTPLQTLRLVTALLEKTPQADPDLPRRLETVRTAADRAVQIALDLLECCRGPSSSRRRKQSTWFALEPFLKALDAEQSVTAEQKGLVWTTDFSALSGWEICIDRVRLSRLLANLLVNAIRYTSQGRVEFTALWRNEPDGTKLDLSVVDSGPGISPEEQESIFQPFERGRAGSKDSDSGGSGLGLSVVDRLVDELGLTMEVFSQFGHGSAFHLLVPGSMLRRAEEGASPS